MRYRLVDHETNETIGEFDTPDQVRQQIARTVSAGGEAQVEHLALVYADDAGVERTICCGSRILDQLPVPS